MILDFGFFKIETFDIRCSANADQNLVDDQLSGLTVVLVGDNAVRSLLLDLLSANVKMKLNAFGGKGLLQNSGGVLILPRQQPGSGFENGHFTAKAGESLGHFTANGAGT